MKKCEECGKLFKPYRSDKQKFCSVTCQRLPQRRRRNEKYGIYTTGLNSGKNGALSELEVCSFYIREGWEVFRNVSQNGKADIVIWNEETGEIRLIDVKTNIEPTKKDIKRIHEQVEILQYNYNTRTIHE